MNKISKISISIQDECKQTFLMMIMSRSINLKSMLHIKSLKLIKNLKELSVIELTKLMWKSCFEWLKRLTWVLLKLLHRTLNDYQRCSICLMKNHLQFLKKLKFLCFHQTSRKYWRQLMNSMTKKTINKIISNSNSNMFLWIPKLIRDVLRVFKSEKFSKYLDDFSTLKFWIPGYQNIGHREY